MKSVKSGRVDKLAGVSCFTAAANDSQQKAIDKLYKATFTSSQLNCAEAAQYLGFCLGCLACEGTELHVFDKVIAKLIGSTTGHVDSHVISKFKDTLIYYSEEKDLQTHDVSEAIRGRNWLPLKYLIDNEVQVFASHKYFFKQVWELLKPDEHKSKQPRNH